MTPRRPGPPGREQSGTLGDATPIPADAPGATDAGAAEVAYVRNTALMTAGTILSRATGLVRVSVLAWALGVSATSLADTYNTANTAPNILYELVLGGILTSVFVPVFVQWRQERGREAAWGVADRVLTIASLVLTALVALGIAFAPAIARLYMPEADEAQLALATYLLRWFMPQVVFYGIGAIAGGLLNAEGRFAAPMFAPVLNNLVVIASVVAYASIRGDAPATVAEVTGVQRALLGGGTTLGVLAMTVALWPSLRRVGYRWRPRLGIGHPAVRRLVRLSAWVMLYVAANQVAYAIVVRIANSLSDGSLTAYQYAFLIFSFPHAVFAVSIITALVPSMAERWTARDRDGLVERFSRGIRDTSAIMVPAAFGFVALAGPIARIVLQRGLASAADAELVGRVLVAFAIGLPFFSVFQLLTRTFYAMQDSRTPALVNVGAAAVNVAAALTFVVAFDLGVAGAALGHAASYVAGTLALLVVLRGRTGTLDGARIASTLARVVPAAALTGAAALGIAELVERATGGAPGTLAQLGQVAGAVAAGVLVFVVLASIVGIREVRDVRRALLRRFRG